MDTYTDIFSLENSDYCTHYFNDPQPCKPLETKFQNFWAHVELGAGNYGKDGHTKISQEMTVLMEFQFVSETPNYITTLNERDVEPYKPEHQFAVLFKTLDQLVYNKGPFGIVHVNDLFAEYADNAADELKKYASSKGYNNVIIESVSGDYTQIIPRLTLEKYSKTLYDSAHLKNPEVSFYNYGMDGSKMLSDKTSREKARTKLQTLANLSYKGLYFFPIDYEDAFVPRAEKEEFIRKGIFYHKTTDYNPVAYYFPEGGTIPKRYGGVYWISTNFTCGFNVERNLNL
jgi:hypothetical protein